MQGQVILPIQADAGVAAPCIQRDVIGSRNRERQAEGIAVEGIAAHHPCQVQAVHAVGIIHSGKRVMVSGTSRRRYLP